MRHPKLSTPYVVIAAVLVSGGIGACSSASSENVGSASSADSSNACKAHQALLNAAVGKHSEDDDGDEGEHEDGDDHGGGGGEQADNDHGGGGGGESGDHDGEHENDDDHPDPAKVGKRAFNDRKLHGLGANGRACADCHMASESFQLSPAAVNARWDALQACRARKPKADDPLFRPIDADDFRTNGAAASSFKNLKHGLVRVVIPLPSNIKLIDPATNAPSTEVGADLWRSVPSVLNVATTGSDGVSPVWPPVVPAANTQRGPGQAGPNVTGGYQLDARVDTLQNQALGAFIGHAQVTTAPSASILDGIAAFENGLVTPAAPALSPLEQQGQAIFTRSCTQCHGGAGGTTPLPLSERYHDIRTACPRPADVPTWCVASGGKAPCPPRFAFKACPSAADVPGLQPRTYEITLAGKTFRRASTDPGRALLTGYAGQGGGTGPNAIANALDDWQKLEVSPVRGTSMTAPYFHNNTAATLEEVLDHYTAFFTQITINTCSRPIGCTDVLTTVHGSKVADRPFTAAERPALLAYIKTL